ncbi:leucine-rich repeat-containing protein 58 [Lethenteron reissneri]|uniref:leucine-rich repeat-containing protein 58 n=1 Tax=Lethenteron reissneri TaxID=7753 RepID=UPI002AB621E7|nr:leucine-rich repeat-containing protein 58 [Lethenteron reissneri]
MDVLEELQGERVLILSRLDAAELSLAAVDAAARVSTQQLVLTHNALARLPPALSSFTALSLLDVSSNALVALPEELTALASLRTLLAKNNRLDASSLPKDFGRLHSLESLNLSGNRFCELPPQLLSLGRLRSLSLGGNRLRSIPPEISRLSALEVLYLGGNAISSVPPELALLPRLACLGLCDNRVQSIPPEFAQMHALRSLSLHNNLLMYLPREILHLVGLAELSLRGNPLVVRFVRDQAFRPPALLELAARAVRAHSVPYTSAELPEHVARYLDSASKCPNPRCAGVYFDARVRHIKFVDFCGKYRLPLMHYLCSPQCSSPPGGSTSPSDAESEDDSAGRVEPRHVQKVLLG